MASHEEIASALIDLYKLLVSMGYIADGNICWAPHSAETLNVDLCKSNVLSDLAISLLQKLPWPKKDISVNIDLIRKSTAVLYSDSVNIKSSRQPTHPDFDTSEIPHRTLPEDTIALSFGQYDEGFSLVLDAKEGTIKEWWQDHSLIHEQSIDACQYFKDAIQRYSTLQEVPANGEILSPDYDDETRKPYAKTKQMFLAYGWPDAFRKDDFVRDIEGMQEKWQEEAVEEEIRELEEERAALEMEQLSVQRLGGEDEAQ